LGVKLSDPNPADPAAARTEFVKYLDQVMTFTNKDGVSVQQEPDEGLMNNLEGKLGISKGHAQEFRRAIAGYVISLQQKFSSPELGTVTLRFRRGLKEIGEATLNLAGTGVTDKEIIELEKAINSGGTIRCWAEEVESAKVQEE
jgi:hypothetical protein